jgi:hypothetical protein
MKSPRVNPKYRIIAVMCSAAFLFVFQFGWQILSPTPGEISRGLPGVAIEIGMMTLLSALVMVFFKSGRLPNYKLLVDEESITGVMAYTGWMRWFCRHCGGESDQRLASAGASATVIEVERKAVEEGHGLRAAADSASTLAD